MPRRKETPINFLEYQLYRIGRALDRILGKVEEVTEGLDALDAGIHSVKDVADRILTVVDAIVVKLQSQPNAPDFTSEVQTLQGIKDELSGEADKADAALGTTPPPAPPAPADGGAAPGSGEAPPVPPPTGQ